MCFPQYGFIHIAFANYLCVVQCERRGFRIQLSHGLLSLSVGSGAGLHAVIKTQNIEVKYLLHLWKVSAVVEVEYNNCVLSDAVVVN